MGGEQMKRTAGRFIPAFLLSATLLLALGGCFLASSPPQKSAVLRQNMGQLEFAVCEDVEVTRVNLSVRDADQRWTSVLVLDEPFSLKSGELLSTDPTVSPQLAGGLVKLPDLSEGQELWLAIYGVIGGDKTSIGGYWTIQAGGLSDEEWVYPSGNVVDVPCAPAPR